MATAPVLNKTTEGMVTFIFTKPILKETEDYVTGRFG